MAHDGKIDAAARMRWLGELAAVLREAERLTRALSRCRAKGPEAVLLHARIVAARNDVKSLQRANPSKLSGEIDPLWTLSLRPDRPHHDKLP